MPKLSLNVADLRVTSFDAVAPRPTPANHLLGRPTLIDCTYPRYSCLLVCP